jgi:hypothetical protein
MERFCKLRNFFILAANQNEGMDGRVSNAR